MKIRSLILMICIAAFFPHFLLAKDFIAHCRDYPPELYFHDKKCVGAVPELVSDIFSELGHNIIWVKAPWLRSLKDAKEGRVDLLIRHSMTPERELFLRPIKYADRIRKLLFFRSPALKSDITSYEDLQKVVVGSIRGAFYSPKFAKLDTRRMIFVEKTEQLVSMLELNRIDIAVSSTSHNKELFENQFEESTFSDTFYNPVYISIPKNSQAIKYYDDIASLMLKYRKNNKIDQYFERYELAVPEQVF